MAGKTKKKASTKLRCTECKNLNYFVQKSRGLAEEKFEPKKFCNACRKHTIHKEARK